MIFEDPTKRRWTYTLVMFWGMVCLGIVLTGLYGMSLFSNPPLPSIQRLQHIKKVSAQISRQTSAASSANSTPPKHLTVHPESASGAFAAFPKKGATLMTAFLIQDDPDSISSFQEHADQLDAVFPDWFFLTSATCGVDERIDPDVQKVLLQSAIPLFPRVANGDNDSWHTPQINALLANDNERICTAETLAAFAKKTGVRGLNIDIETIEPRNKDNFLEFLIELGQALHAQGQLLTVDITANDPAYDTEQIGQIADAVVLMNYDEHYLSSPPGPIAHQEWFDDNVDQITHSVPPNKIIVALGNYATDWATNEPTNSMKFSDVMALADDSDALPIMDPQSRNMHFAYSDEKNVQHEVWFLNSVTAWNEYLKISHSGVLGMGLWRLGSEDPTLWRIFASSPPSSAALDSPSALRSILYLSQGEIFRLRSSPHAGAMTTGLDVDGSIESAQYDTLPSGYLLERVGGQISQKTLLLTFDDGPDPQWTPEILATLTQLHVPATFFLVGQQAEQNPSLVRTMAKEGFLVGNHTYLHPDLSQVSPERIRLELNATQRAIEEEYGRKTILFRPPYNTDSNPDSANELDPLQQVAAQGYVVVGANIDASDWKRPGAAAIAQYVIDQARNPDNHIIVLHDAGGDRSQTVAALRLFIPALEKQGYTFASLDAATGIPRSALMPAMQQSELLLVYAHMFTQWLLRWGWVIISWLFLFTTLLAIGRILLLGSLVLRSLRKKIPLKSDGTADHLPISILIPAFNEEKTIGQTIHSLQQGAYKEMEILVIDDGSTDGTPEIVRRLQQGDPRIRLVLQANGGKASALNHGLREATHDIIVTIDADTIMMPHTLEHLIAPFHDAGVDAVCGNVEVGNVHSILTGFQSLEYITTQNFDRRAFDELNCISVVPGATGAWRRAGVLDSGGYSDQTLTEDADLTLMLLRQGGKIVYAPLARSKTEAPETVRALSKQRFRWSFGTFQCLWKHRDAFFEGALGWVALPNMFFFQVLFPVLSPIGDLIFLLSILRGDIGAVASGYILFLFMDLCGSLLAFTLEKRSKRLMWLVLIQRLFYRQFMYVITFRAIIAILHGGKYGWNKLERRGNVVAQ